MRSAALLLVLTAAFSPALGASEPYLVRDINPVPLGVGSEPGGFQGVAGGRVAFSADDGFLGRELWGSDGTAAGTVLLADTCPGPCSGSPGLIAAIAGTFSGRAAAAVFAAADEAGEDRHLWWTDGTPAGTLRLTGRPVRPTFDNVWVAERGLYFFTVDDPAAGRELWVSEVRRGSARRLLDLGPGPAPATIWLRSFGGRAFFFADDGVSGPNLWTSDGTAAGTRLVKDTWPRSASHGAPVRLTVAGNRLFFVATSPERGFDLWRSDGTAAGTVPVSDLVPGPESARFNHLTAMGNRLFFKAQVPRVGQEMWVTDGTARGTRRLTNFPRELAFVSSQHTSNTPDVFGNRLVFQAHDGAHGEELWVSDGTPVGTVLLADVCPGPCPGVQSWFLAHGGRFFFEGFNPVRGFELWVSDGTPAGTRLFKDLCRGACWSSPGLPEAVGPHLLFFASNGPGVEQLWRTDGTPRGTVRVRAFPGQSGRPIPMPATGAVLFAAEDPEHGRELWRSDGTPAGTAMVKDIDTAQVGGSFPNPVGALGGDLLFFADDGEHGIELWASDGTAPGTRLVHATAPGEPPATRPFGDAVEWRGALFYPAEVQVSATLWRSDGTADGTRQLTPGGVRLTGDLFAGDRFLFFTAHDGQERRLWISDGTTAGTRPLGFDASPLASFAGRLVYFAGENLLSTDGTDGGVLLQTGIRPTSTPRQHAVAHGGRLYFFAEDFDLRKVELWQTDGTASGTRRAPEIALSSGSFSPTYLGSFGGRLVVSGYGEEGSGLWVSDGTAGGTVRISEAVVDGGQFVPAPVAAGSRLFFVLFEGRNTRLWSTDGTAAGTGPVLDAAGEAIVGPGSLAAIGGRLYVADGALGTGSLIWVTDGTPAGTARLHDPQTDSWVVRAGNRIFFPGYDRASGTELWAIEE